MDRWNAFKKLESGCSYHVGLYYAEGDAEAVYTFETLLNQSFGLRCFLKSRDYLSCGFSGTEFEVIDRCFTESKTAILVASHNLLKDPLLTHVAQTLYEQQMVRPSFVVIVAALDDEVLPRSRYLHRYPRLNLYEGNRSLLCQLIWYMIGGVSDKRQLIVQPPCFGDVVNIAGIWLNTRMKRAASTQQFDRIACEVLASFSTSTSLESGCRLCRAGIVDALRHIHTAVCAATVVSCPNDGCTLQETRHLLSLHVRHCPYGMLRCPKCEEPVIRKDLREHRSRCLAISKEQPANVGQQSTADSLYELVGSGQPMEDNVTAIIRQWRSKNNIEEGWKPVESLESLADYGLTSYPIKELLKLLVLSGDMTIDTYDELVRQAGAYRESNPSRSDNLAYLSSLRSLCPSVWSAIVRSEQGTGVVDASSVLQSVQQKKKTQRSSGKQSQDQVMQILLKPRRER